jgi:hypothetical protein
MRSETRRKRCGVGVVASVGRGFVFSNKGPAVSGADLPRRLPRRPEDAPVVALARLDRDLGGVLRRYANLLGDRRLERVPPFAQGLDCRIPSTVLAAGFNIQRLRIQQVASLASSGSLWPGLLNPTIVVEAPG